MGGRRRRWGGKGRWRGGRESRLMGHPVNDHSSWVTVHMYTSSVVCTTVPAHFCTLHGTVDVSAASTSSAILL